jgi:hypothetical protein
MERPRDGGTERQEQKDAVDPATSPRPLTDSGSNSASFSRSLRPSVSLSLGLRTAVNHLDQCDFQHHCQKQRLLAGHACRRTFDLLQQADDLNPPTDAVRGGKGKFHRRYCFEWDESLGPPAPHAGSQTNPAARNLNRDFPAKTCRNHGSAKKHGREDEAQISFPSALQERQRRDRQVSAAEQGEKTDDRPIRPRPQKHIGESSRGDAFEVAHWPSRLRTMKAYGDCRVSGRTRISLKSIVSAGWAARPIALGSSMAVNGGYDICDCGPAQRR